MSSSIPQGNVQFAYFETMLMLQEIYHQLRKDNHNERRRDLDQELAKVAEVVGTFSSQSIWEGALNFASAGLTIGAGIALGVGGGLGWTQNRLDVVGRIFDGLSKVGSAGASTARSYIEGGRYSYQAQEKLQRTNYDEHTRCAGDWRDACNNMDRLTNQLLETEQAINRSQRI